MYSPAIAERLRAAGHDVVAVKERPDLIGLPDRQLLLAAEADRRAIVTENVKDFAVLHAALSAADESHHGVIFVHPRRFPRHARDHVTSMVKALAVLLERDAPSLGATFSWWLGTGR